MCGLMRWHLAALEARQQPRAGFVVSLSDQGLTNRDAPGATKPQTLVGMKVGATAEKPQNEDESTGQSS